MKGMELSRGYFEEYGKPMIDTQLAQYKQYLAAGLVGEGSECLGFDDVFSADHDFGPAFCIWMPEQIYARAGAEIQRAYDSLPAFYQGYARITSAQGGGRVGALSLEGFYSRFTGLSRAPKDNMEWFRIPDVRVYGNLKQEIRRVSVCPGSAKGMEDFALAQGGEVLIGGDFGHHEGLDCLEKHIAVIDAGHYGLEHVFIDDMAEFLAVHCPEIQVCKAQEAYPFHTI